MKIQKLIEATSEITDPRRRYGNLRHKLTDILVIGLCTILCKGEDFTDMEDFGNEREAWLKTFLELPNGIPDSDTFRRVFERINPAELSNALYDWLGTEREKRGIIAIDGKTICGSGNGEHKAYHVVSAFVAENQITLGEITVDEKSNEIKAIPQLLDLVDVSGATVTVDAMGCQTDIAAKIVKKKADYCLALKGNQSNLHDDVRLYFENLPAEQLFVTREKGHGRVEKREYFLETDINWLPQKSSWKKLNAIGAVKSTVFEKSETRIETRYFITSLTDVNQFADAVRKHWSIENQLHWQLDVTFGEDDSRARKDNSPLNLNVLRKTALVLLKEVDWGRIGLKKKMFIAALNPGKLLQVLFAEK
ncbi:putative transposase YncI [Clostridia bacterium]|nr:putative transposase YncI [Clostridia bacterium]